MKLPETVRVGPFVYTVKLDDSLIDDRTNDGAWGLTRHQDQEILLKGSLHPMQHAETLTHEMLHVVWGLTALRKDFVRDDQEKIVTALAPIMLMVLRDNPALLRYLTKVPETG